MSNSINAENHPLVSIITVVYNGEKTIEQTIMSVLNQSYPNIEYIIIDGKSNDGTMHIISKYKDKIAYVISEKDNGIYDAMNKGIALASGKVIGLLNADDHYELDTIENIIKYYKPGLVNYYGALRNIDENNNVFINEATNKLSKLKRGMVVNHPTLFVNSDVYKKLGNFDTDFKIAADWDFTLRCYLHGVQFIKISKVLTNFRIGGVSGAITLNYLKEMSLIREKNGVIRRFDYYYLYDGLRFFILGKYLHKLYLIKKKLKNAH